jgi:hypothetical protein
VAGVSLRASPDSWGASGRGGGTSRVIHASVSSPTARWERAPDRVHARPPTRRSRKAGLADAPTAARTANILASQPHREVTPRPQLLAPRATRTAEPRSAFRVRSLVLFRETCLASFPGLRADS